MELIDTDIRPWSVEDVKEQFGDSLTLLPPNDNIKELQSILRDRLVRLPIPCGIPSHCTIADLDLQQQQVMSKASRMIP